MSEKKRRELQKYKTVHNRMRLEQLLKPAVHDGSQLYSELYIGWEQRICFNNSETSRTVKSPIRCYVGDTSALSSLGRRNSTPALQLDRKSPQIASARSEQLGGADEQMFFPATMSSSSPSPSVGFSPSLSDTDEIETKGHRRRQ